MANYATKEPANSRLNQTITINAGHVTVTMKTNCPNYQDIIEKIADLMCEHPPLQLLEKLQSI